MGNSKSMGKFTVKVVIADTVDGKKPAPVNMWVIPLFTGQGFIHPRWCRNSSINRCFFLLIGNQTILVKSMEKSILESIVEHIV